MECFIKKIFLDRVDEQVHNKFVRFGKGKYENRAVLSLNKSNKIKLKGSFEYANDFVLFVSEFQANFSGVILSKEKLDLENEKLKNGLYVYEVSDLTKEKVKEISDKTYYILLDAEAEGLSLKIKKKLPKPGKSRDLKIDGKFCVLEADLRYYPQVKEAFFWDVEGKRIKVSHDYIINELKIPENEKNLELIRLKTKRKGKIIRKIEVDGNKLEKEKDFEV